MTKTKRKNENQTPRKLKKLKPVFGVTVEIAKEITDETQIMDEYTELENSLTQKEYYNITLADLKTVVTLGKGGFAKVDLVHHILNPSLTFALKRMKKDYVVKTNQQQHMLNERNLMLGCNNQFICRMFTTFRDDKHIYMLLEACLGGEVWTILRNKKIFDIRTTKFIVACVTEAFQYLHPRGIVYRDLKPENLLLDCKGYVKLVDFGFAKYVGLEKKTWTFCGTPAYLAPEMIRKKGHNKAVDYWALGILTHELLTGDVPFDDADAIKLFYNILKGFDCFQFKDISYFDKRFIMELCKIIPSDRLGCQKNGLVDIRNHIWFQGFDWDSLVAGSLPAPIRNPIRSSLDASNFDPFKEEEEEEEKEMVQDEFPGWDESF